MRYIKFFGSASFCGTDEEVYDLFLDETTDEELDDIAEEKRRELGESYEYLATQEYDEEDYDSEEDFEEVAEETETVEAEENTVYLDEIKIQVAEEFGDKIPEIKKAVTEEYKTVLVVEKMV